MHKYPNDNFLLLFLHEDTLQNTENNVTRFYTIHRTFLLFFFDKKWKIVLTMKNHQKNRYKAQALFSSYALDSQETLKTIIVVFPQKRQREEKWRTETNSLFLGQKPKGHIIGTVIIPARALGGGVKRIFVTPKMTLSIMKQHSTNKLKTLSDNYETHNSNHLTQHLKHQKHKNPKI